MTDHNREEREALVEKAKRLVLIDRTSREPVVAMLSRVTDALESTLAELRQERERADAYRIMQRETAKTAREMRAESDAALSRAEETIEKVLAVPNEFEWDIPPTVKHVLNTAPVDALRAVRAEAWDEGWVSAVQYEGRCQDAEAAGQGVLISKPANPYRETKEQN